MKILLHTCCAPCAIYPIRVLQQSSMNVTAFFYKHNIHPYTECVKRRDALRDYASQIGIRLIEQRGYDVTGFLRQVVYREVDRCDYCYHDRLKSAAMIARRGRYDLFSTSLLYSKFQKHDRIRDIGEAVGRSTGVPFYYHDFREGWKDGIAESKALGMYRQQYCGCIYSERERYYRNETAR